MYLVAENVVVRGVDIMDFHARDRIVVDVVSRSGRAAADALHEPRFLKRAWVRPIGRPACAP